MSWNDWFKHKRGRRGDPGFISLDEVASRMDLSRTRVIQIERLDEAPPFPTRQKVHAVFGTSDDELRAAGVVLPGDVETRSVPVTIGVAHADLTERDRADGIERIARLDDEAFMAVQHVADAFLRRPAQSAHPLDTGELPITPESQSKKRLSGT